MRHNNDPYIAIHNIYSTIIILYNQNLRSKFTIKRHTDP